MKASKRMSLSDLPPHLQKVALAQMAVKPLNTGAPALPEVGVSKRIRQRSGDGMNKLERSFYEWLCKHYPHWSVHREVSLPIANGVRYKIDFLVARSIAEVGTTVIGFEVKGKHAWDDAIVKAKCAAKEFPWIEMTLVSRGTLHEWDMQRILP